MTAGNPCLLAIQEVEASGLLTRCQPRDPFGSGKSPAWRQREWQQTAADRWWRLDRQHRRKLVDAPTLSSSTTRLPQMVSTHSEPLRHGLCDYGWSYNEVLRVAAELPEAESKQLHTRPSNPSGHHPKLQEGIIRGGEPATGTR